MTGFWKRAARKGPERRLLCFAGIGMVVLVLLSMTTRAHPAGYRGDSDAAGPPAIQAHAGGSDD